MNKNLLCLKWDDFDNFVVNGLSNLYQKDDMSDTTLFCDGRSFKAHKIVLSIWSSYFREILTSTTHSHPVIVLRETTSSDLELILRFIYQGQLFVPFEDTERFLKTAEYFQIAGLRDMRVHLSSSETNPGNSGGSIKSSSASGPMGAGVHSSVNLNNGHANGPSASTSFASPTPSYAVHQGVHTTSIDGIPVQILGSSSTSPTQHAGHPNSINPTSITNCNSTGSSLQTFSTNVIKPIPSRQTSRLHQPSVLPLVNNVLAPPSYSHNLPNPCHRQGPDLIYGTQPQPILIVHNQQQKPNEYHDSSKSMLESRSPEQVLVFERAGNGSSALDRKISSMGSLGSGVNDNSILNNYNNHIQHEEVLGLDYLHENNSSRTSSNHSHIIQEAAVAAGVSTEDTEIIEINRDPFTSTDSVNGKPTKINSSVVLTPTTSTPVYAVKRVPVHTSSISMPEGSKASTNFKPKSVKLTSATSNNSNSNKVFKSDRRRQRGISSQNSEIEFVNCPKCDKRVKKTSLKVHIRRTHLEEGTFLICPICSKQISSKGVYYKHMYGHRQKSTDIKPNLPNQAAKGKE